MNPFSNRRRIVVVALATAAAVVLVATAKPAYRAVNLWRAHRVLAQAEAQANRNDWPNAAQSLREAHLLAPGDAELTRATVRLLSRRNDPQVLALLETLIHSSEGQPQDRIEFVQMAVRLGRLTEVQDHLLILLRDPQTAVRFDVLKTASEWYGRCGERSRAIKFAREALARASDDQQAAEGKLLLAGSLLQHGVASGAEPPPIEEAKQLLWELAARDDQAGLQALLVLSEACKSAPSLPEAEQLSGRLGSHPLASEDQRLLAQTWALQAEPGRRDLILDEVVSNANARGAERTAAVGRWLNQQGESQRVLDLLPLASARAKTESLLVHFDALANLGKWSEIKGVLAEDAALPITPTVRRLYELRTALALGSEDESHQHWYDVQHSMRQAEPETVLYVAQYAERLGKLEEAGKAYRVLTGMTGAERAGYLGLIRLTERSGETRQLRDQLKELTDRFSSESEAQNDLAYLDLLLNENVVPARVTAERLVKRSPELLAYRTTLALACLRSNDATAARAVYREFATDWSIAHPGWRAVYAAVLAATGEQNLARVEAGELKGQLIRPEERELIGSLGSAPASAPEE